MTKQDLQSQLKESMLAKDALKTSVLRLLLSAINYHEIQKGGAGYSATEEDVMQIIGNQAKQRRDSITEFEKAGRQELIDKEKAELKILEAFLPAQMSEDDIVKEVEKAIASTNASTQQDMGKVMGALSGLKGNADMGKVSSLVREKLTS